jgi:hypothetical protein
MPLDRIRTPHPDNFQLPKDVVQSEALKPFDSREALVERIAEGYSSSLYSPPNSPPSSPSRSISLPFITPQTLKPMPQLSQKVKEDLLADWTRDVCIAENTKDATTASMTGSRTATSYHQTQKNNYLGVTIPNGFVNLDSPVPSPRRAHSRSRPPSTAYGLVGRVNSPHRNRSPSGTPGSTSSRSAVRVDELKRVLSGAAPRTSYSIRPATSRRADSDRDHDSSASDSLVSVHSLSDASFVTADPPPPMPTQAGSPNLESPTTGAATLTPRGQPQSSSSGVSNPHSPNNYAQYAHGVPPVPPIPASLRDKSASPTHSPNLRQQSPNPGTFQGSPSGNQQDRPKTAPSGNGSIAARKSRSMKRGSQGARSVRERSGSRTSGLDGSSIGNVNGNGNGNGNGNLGRDKSSRKVKKPDFSGFLDSIDAGDADEDMEVDLNGVGRAPY